MAAATSRAIFKPIKAKEKYHACISYHKTDKETVKKHIVKELKKLNFEIEDVSCGSETIDDFPKSLKESDAWIEVLTDGYKDCRCCESRYITFTETRQKTKTKELQKLIQIPQDGDRQKILLRVHSDYSADIDAFRGLESSWLDDLQRAIVTRFHVFLSYHKSNEKLAEEIMKWLTERDYLVTHRRKFLSANDAKKKAVNEKMSDKIITLFSDLYMENRGDLDLVMPIVRDRGQEGWIPVVIEWSNAINQFLDYHPKVILVMSADKRGLKETEKWEKGLKKLQKGIDNPEGLPSDCGTARQDGPPGILAYQSIKSVVHSVGKIRVKSPEYTAHGTGFCVGKKETPEKRYVFTAYHVIGQMIDRMILSLVERCEEDQAKKQNLLEKIGFRKEEVEYANKVYNYRQTKAGELKLGDYTENEEKVVKRWEGLSIDFLCEKGKKEKENFHFERNIPFMSQEHDVILLMLKASTGSNFPDPLQLDFRGIDEFWHLVGCKAGQEITNVAIATWCPVFKGHSFDDSNIWWSRRKTDQKQLKDTDHQFFDLDDLGQVPFKCTEFFENGCSGSPCWHVDPSCSSKDVYVQGLYLGCLPDVYFTKQKEKPEALAFRHRPERALPMKKIFEILNNLKLSALIDDLGFYNQR